MVFIKTLMNADQIYSYLLKLKLNLRIGPISNYKDTYYGYTKMISLCLRKSKCSFMIAFGRHSVIKHTYYVCFITEWRPKAMVFSHQGPIQNSQHRDYPGFHIGLERSYTFE